MFVFFFYIDRRSQPKYLRFAALVIDRPILNASRLVIRPYFVLMTWFIAFLAAKDLFL